MRIPISFIISGLGVGGAQMMLHKLLSKIDREQFAPKVISLVANPDMIKKFVDIDVPVTNLAMVNGVSIPKGLAAMTRILHKEKPQIVQTWMYHADLLGGLCARVAGRRPVIWNIRHSNLDPEDDKKTTLYVAKICARLSCYLPKHIVCCSETAAKIHEKLGYDSSKIIVIPNGFDLHNFRPDSEARHELRDELGVSDNKILIGLVGRYHPHKDHKNFILAAEILNRKLDNCEFLLCGNDIDWQNEALAEQIDRAGLRSVFHLLGLRNDIPKVTASLDIATSASSGEGFSNTIGEAMACGVPCVVTDVGDSAMIVGSTGRVVPPRNPGKLSLAWLALATQERTQRRDLGLEARKRMINNFAIDTIVDQYQNLYRRSLC